MKSILSIIALSVAMSGCASTFPQCSWSAVSPEELARICKDSDPKLNACQGGDSSCTIYVRNDLRRPDQIMCSPEGKVVDKNPSKASPVPAGRGHLAPGSKCKDGKPCEDL